MTRKHTVLLAVAANSVETPAAQQTLQRAADVLRAGGTVAFPTETVYGLGANALDARAVERIFLAKQRPAWDPLIVHVSEATMLGQVAADIPARAQKLMDAFWPGPLTLLLPKTDAIPAAVTSGRSLVGVRIPAHPVARAFIEAAGVPVAAPSANRFGHTSPTNAQHVLDDLDGRIDLVLDAGPTPHGIESTVIEVGESAVIVYRPGAISVEEIEAVAGPVVLHQARDRNLNLAIENAAEVGHPSSLPSPGVGIRHYAPRARVVLVETAAEEDSHPQWVQALREHSSNRVGVMLPDGWRLPGEFFGVHYAWGNWRSDRELAKRLFSGLRALDVMGADVILCPLPGNDGLGAALRDRLRKAAREE
ncbi:MAG: L-threonylcarbamoyladenylate synthase [Acidobacteriaceae bacterium]